MARLPSVLAEGRIMLPARATRCFADLNIPLAKTGK